MLLAEVWRGSHVESRHHGAFVVADAAGGVIVSGGDLDEPVFPRSAVKAMQALPLLLGGAADKFGLNDAELALACASHDGSELHASTAAATLARAGGSVACLECGTHWPASPAAARALAAAGQAPSALHNNCSGKHAGFVCVAVAAGTDPAGYVAPDHAVMREVTACLAEVTRCRLDAANMAVDGCRIPTFAIPLRSVAAGFARFGAGTGMPDGFAEAASRLRRAVAAHTVMVAGEGRFDTRIAEAFGTAAFVKMGAEGVHAAALPGLGLGLAIKCADGAARAAEVAMAALLRRFLAPEGDTLLTSLAEPILRNWDGEPVGAIRPGPALASG